MDDAISPAQCTDILVSVGISRVQSNVPSDSFPRAA